MVQRVEVAEHLRPLGQPAEREERARDEEERRQHRADDVVEVLDRGRVAGDGDAEAGPAVAREERDHGTRARAEPPVEGSRRDEEGKR